MKRRALRNEVDMSEPVRALVEALAALRSASAVRDFLHDLCTPAEIEALADRWRVVPHLLGGESYREIHDATGVSVTTIGRVARCLAEGEGYRAAAAALGWSQQRLPTSLATKMPAPPANRTRRPAPGATRKTSR